MQGRIEVPSGYLVVLISEWHGQIAKVVWATPLLDDAEFLGLTMDETTKERTRMKRHCCWYHSEYYSTPIPSSSYRVGSRAPPVIGPPRRQSNAPLYFSRPSFCRCVCLCNFPSLHFHSPIAPQRSDISSRAKDWHFRYFTSNKTLDTRRHS